MKKRPMYENILGSNIVRMREEQGWGNRILFCKQYNIHYRTLQDIETGKRKNPRDKTLEPIAKALKTTIQELRERPERRDPTMDEIKSAVTDAMRFSGASIASMSREELQKMLKISNGSDSDKDSPRTLELFARIRRLNTRKFNEIFDIVERLEMRPVDFSNRHSRAGRKRSAGD